MKIVRNAGNWWSDSNIGLLEIDGTIYALSGWNGEKWLHCWRCIDKFTAAPDDREYEITPVYEFADSGDDDDEQYNLVDYRVQ